MLFYIILRAISLFVHLEETMFFMLNTFYLFMWFKITTCLLDVQAANLSPFLLKCTSKIPPSALNVFFNDPFYIKVS